MSATAVLQKADQLDQLTEQLEGLLEGLAKSKRAGADGQEVARKLSAFQSQLDAAQLEMNGLSAASLDAPKKADLTKRLRVHKANLKEMHAEWDKARVKIDKAQLMSGAKPAAAPAAAASSSSAASASSLMSHGLATQSQSASSLLRTLRVIQDAKAIGVETNEKLHGQTEQIGKIARPSTHRPLGGGMRPRREMLDRCFFLLLLLTWCRCRSGSSHVCRRDRVDRFDPPASRQHHKAHPATHVAARCAPPSCVATL